MKVQKRNGSFEEISFDKVLLRIRILSGDNAYKTAKYSALSKLNVDPVKISQKGLLRNL